MDSQAILDDPKLMKAIGGMSHQVACGFGKPDMTDDLKQQAWIYLLEYRGGNLEAFSRQVLTYRLIDYMRSKSVSNSYDAQFPHISIDAYIAEEDHESFMVHNHAFFSIMIIEQALQQLDRRTADILMKYYSGDKQDEIAEHYGISRSCISHIITQGLMELREILSTDEERANV